MSLLRSTKFVRYFTGAARTLILNSAKAAESNTLINPKAISGANILIRDYTTSKNTESLEPLLQKLDSEVRRFGRIAKKDIDEVFDEIRTKNNITSSQSLLVIRCCGELVPEELPEHRTLLVQKIWNVLTERGIPMDISHYNALLRVYIENEHPFSPAQFLEELEKKGLQPNRVTYQRLMWRYCQEGDVEGATKVLEKMRELSFPVSEPVLNALVMGHAFHGDTEGATAVLETMAGAGLEPTDRTYTLLACGYAKKGDMEGVQKVIRTSTEKDAYMTDKDILDIIEHLTLGGHGNKVDELFSHLQKSMGYNQEVCNLILRLLNKGHEDIAKKVMRTMPKSSNEDTRFKGAFFVKHLLKLNRAPDAVIKTCRELQEEGLVPSALYIATEAALQHGQSELALKLFKELKNNGIEIRQHYYWPLLAQKSKENDEEGLLQVLREMSVEGIPVAGEALRDYVLPYLIKKDTPQNVILKLQIATIPAIVCARNVMLELLEAGETVKAAEIALQYRPWGQYNLISRPLLHALGKTKDIESFTTILHVISSGPQSQINEDTDESERDNNIDKDEVGRIIKSAVKFLTKPDLCEKLLSALRSKGLRISSDTAESIEQYLDGHMTSKLSELLSQLTSPDLELAPVANMKRDFGPSSASQLEQLINQAKSRGGSNLNRLQKQLLNAYVKENNVEKVKSYVDELKASNFELSTMTLAQLHEFYCQNDDVDKANECKTLLHEKNPNFAFNKFKSILMTYAYIRTNRYEEAIKFLTETKPREESEPSLGFTYNSKCWQILNYLAEQKDVEKVRNMTKVLIDHNYIEPSNVMLGPLIKVHLLKEDIEEALSEFEKCCNQYRSTPWKGELMKALIMKEDATKLQWVADLSTRIHGEVNILHDLVLAFVECGRLRQARRILETPGMHTRQRRLDAACLRYVEEGKSEHLEGLLEATKELSHIDRSNIFYHLLVSYCKADETDKAIGLWTILQEEGEIPSDQFLAYLGKHLRSKNREVPFVIPSESPSRQTTTEVVKDKVNRPTKNDVSDKIESMVKEDRAIEAMGMTIKNMENGIVPKANVIKFLLKNLAEEGNVETIQQLSNHLNDSLKKRVTYDDKLTLAIFNKGAGSSHIDKLVEAVQKANTVEELETALVKYPRSNALASIMDNTELIAKCHHVAEVAADKGLSTPANLLWMEYILKGKDKEADTLWNKTLKTATLVIFRRLLQESHVRNDPQIIEKLITTLKSNKEVSLSALGNVYSRLINLHLMNNRVEEAENTLKNASEFGIKSEHFNKHCLDRLKMAVENAGREFKYSI